MSINPLSSSLSASLLSLSQSTSTSATGSTEGTDSTSAVSASASVDISNPAKLMQQLAQLAEDDPDKFKEVTAKIAKQLGETADKGGEGSDFMKKLASAFLKASESGNADDLRPPKPPGGAGGPPPDGSSGAGAAAYRAHGSQGGPSDSVRQTIDSIISDALSNVS